MFCLGVLQALAEHDTLKNFDYLSTVSGGGSHVGSALTWFTRSGTLFGVGKNDFPYGIDDPTQSPPKNPPGTPLLPHLRRHGSYLDPGGVPSLLAGIAVVLRGIVLNLFVVWLPIVTALFVLLRVVYRNVAWGLQPWVIPAIVAAIFVVLAIVYSLQSGWQAKRHRDMPYGSRQDFERVTPYILGVLAVLLVLASLPDVRTLILHKIASEGSILVGFIMAAGGAALGLLVALHAQG